MNTPPLRRLVWLCLFAVLPLPATAQNVIPRDPKPLIPPRIPPANAPQPRERGFAEGWDTDLDNALQRAGRAGKPVVVFLRHPASPASRAMMDVLQTRAVREALRPMEPVDIDLRRRPHMAARFDVERMPTFVILDTDGEEYDRFGGFLPPEAFVETLKSAADPKQAVSSLRRHIESQPDDMQARWLLARKLARDGRVEELGEQLAEMRRRDPQNRDGYLDDTAWMMLTLTLDPDAPKDAMAALDRFLEEYADSEFADQAALLRAVMLDKQGRRFEALAVLRDFPRDYPDSPLRRYVESNAETLERLEQDLR